MPDTSTATTTFTADEARRAELAEFLKSRRAAIAPARVGLKAGLRRRAPGLLREEVAQLAGISPTWYVWLEQGRDIRPSAEVVSRIAGALLLDDAARQHLAVLAQSASAPVLSTDIPESLRTFIAGLGDRPAYVVNGVWDVLAWSDAAAEWFGDFAGLRDAERNILYAILAWNPWRNLLRDWADVAASAVAQFRAETAPFIGSPRREELIDMLSRRSPEFRAWWSLGAVQTPVVYQKRLRHARFGEKTLTYAPLKPQGAAADVTVVVYSPA